MTHIASAPPALRTDIYERIGVPTIINGRGATTAVGGTLMAPAVLAAMQEASTAFVALDTLNTAVGGKIARLTGAEAGYVSSGSAAAMALAAAACIAGADPDRIRRLPASAGMRNEILIHACHRINYDQMFRVGGGCLIEVGADGPATAAAWEQAISERTAAVAWIDSPNTRPGALDFSSLIAIAHARGLPMIVDAASTLPPIAHLQRWTAAGADLVIYSGGKGIRGPQESGLLAGRRELIEAARANGNPNAGIGRGMKASKEAMVGLWVALDLFLAADHVAEYRVHQTQAGVIADQLGGRADLRCVIEDDWAAWPAPIVRLFPRAGRWQPNAVRDTLIEGDPPIHINAEHGGLMINTHCLRQPEEELIIARLRELLDRMNGRGV